MLEDKGAPKAIAMLVKMISPARHRLYMRAWNTSKSMFGNCCAGSRMNPRTNGQTIKELTWGRPDPYRQINSKAELRRNQGGE